MELETVNRLYLELSQFATAKTAREDWLEDRVKMLEDILAKIVETEPRPMESAGRVHCTVHLDMREWTTVRRLQQARQGA